MCTTALALVHSTAECFSRVWCHSAHTYLLNRPINDALRIVTGILKLIPTEYQPVLFSIPPAELCRKDAALSLAYRSLEPSHTLYSYITCQRPVNVLSQEIHLSSKRKTCWSKTSTLQTGSIIPEKKKKQIPHVFALSLPM